MSIRHLVRKLDHDAIARVKAYIRHESKPIKKVKPPRGADTYRGHRRNAARGTVWRGARPTGAIYHPPTRANRSSKWAPFKGRLYAPDAR